MNKSHDLLDLEKRVKSTSSKSFQEVVEDALRVIPNPIIAGGFAVSFYGFHRFTQDIDFAALGMTPKILVEALKAFEALGYKVEQISFPPNYTIHMATSGDRGIALMEFISENGWDKQVEKRARPGDLFNHPVRYVSPEDLVLMKLLGFRNKDKIDLDELLFKKNIKLDETYLLEWADRLGVLTRLESLTGD